MFKLAQTRRTVAGLAAGVALVGGFGAAIAAPERADAATPSTCRNWEIPSKFSVNQSNGYSIWTLWKTSAYTWAVDARYGGHNGSGPLMHGRLHLTQFDTSGAYPQVRFTITWSNGSAGVYSGTIDGDGFLAGTTSDRWNSNKARWNLAGTVYCLG